MNTYVYVIQTGEYENNYIDSVYLLYDEAKERALEVVDDINNILEEEHESMKDLALYQNVPKSDIPPLIKLIEIEKDKWTNQIEWVLIEKHLLI